MGYDVGETYPSKFLSYDDLGGFETFTVSEVEAGKVGQGAEERDQLIVSFRGQSKKLGLNKTNAKAIAGVYGNNTDKWIGKPVVLYPAEVTFNKQQVPTVRVDGKRTQTKYHEFLENSTRTSSAAPLAYPDPGDEPGY